MRGEGEFLYGEREEKEKEWETIYIVEGEGRDGSSWRVKCVMS